jgi:hypothetical protein
MRVSYHPDYYVELPPTHPFPDVEVPAGIRVALRGRRRVRGRGDAARGSAARAAVARAHRGVPREAGGRDALRPGDPTPRRALVAAAVAPLAPRRRRHAARRARGARGRPRRQPRRRHAPRLRRPRRGLLRAERRGRRGARAAGLRRGEARAGGGPRRAPGQRHGRDLRGRCGRVHAVPARRAQLPDAEDALDAGRRPAGRHRRRGLSRRARAGPRDGAVVLRAGRGLLPRRRGPGGRGPLRPPGADRRRPAPPRPTSSARCAAVGCRSRCCWPAATHPARSVPPNCTPTPSTRPPPSRRRPRPHQPPPGRRAPEEPG